VAVDSQYLVDITKSHAIGTDISDLRKCGYAVDYKHTGLSASGRNCGTYTMRGYVGGVVRVGNKTSISIPKPEKDRKYLSLSETIHVGEYALTSFGNNSFYFLFRGQEGLEIKADKLLSLLEKYFKDNF
jgi:hypothetical protein